MNKSDCEKLKELMSRIVTLEKTTEHLREVMDLKFQNYETSAKVGSVEVNRRLENLNGEAGRLSAMQATYLPREIYEQHHRTMEENAAQNRRANLASTISAIVALLLGALALIVRH